jgi:hypothetical protein
VPSWAPPTIACLVFVVVVGGFMAWTVQKDREAAAAIDRVVSPLRGWDIEDLIPPETPEETTLVLEPIPAVETTLALPPVEWNEAVDYGAHASGVVRYVLGHTARHRSGVWA